MYWGFARVAAADLFFRLWANLDLARVVEGSGFRVSRVSGRCLITFPRYQCKGISDGKGRGSLSGIR